MFRKAEDHCLKVSAPVRAYVLGNVFSSLRASEGPWVSAFTLSKVELRAILVLMLARKLLQRSAPCCWVSVQFGSFPDLLSKQK